MFESLIWLTTLKLSKGKLKLEIVKVINRQLQIEKFVEDPEP